MGRSHRFAGPATLPMTTATPRPATAMETETTGQRCTVAKTRISRIVWADPSPATGGGSFLLTPGFPQGNPLLWSDHASSGSTAQRLAFDRLAPPHRLC